ncbi:hypothetical protein HYFRA_00007800 [Hymenoscyphus fraxineus]|uniref:Phospholipase/carboxylesterase/thioesterase domain-containing protein n=1 Tax=Hymenoscyphus fraxineus TaxID=746836 RepID=A0A9N9PPL3_9HELO|nr:hypothetical protein HYFRA_00007800 [Hymenoscyphus fraxineus]
MSSQTGPTEYTGLFSRSTVKDLPGEFPPPVIVPPKEDHRHTFIILHGRGSTAEKFGPPLLESCTTLGEKLQDAFPHAKLIFLTASKNRATIYKRTYTHQWFDFWHMDSRFKRQELMVDGLHKAPTLGISSCKYIHEILQRETEQIGRNIVLWGLSQGCATSLIALLTWNGSPFAATVGMCGYLPLTNHMDDIMKTGSDSDDGNPFGHDGDHNDDALDQQNLPAQVRKVQKSSMALDTEARGT